MQRLSATLATCLQVHTSSEDAGARQQALEAFLYELSAALARQGSPDRRGRKPVHDRLFAKAALLDFVTTDPDGMPHQAALIRELERRLQAAGHPIPCETWLKQVVREFQTEALAFELEASETFRASPALQAVFTSLGDFLVFRRSKARATQMWREESQLRAQYASPEMLLEAAFHKGFPRNEREGISDHSRLPLPRETESNCSNERSSP